MIVAVDTGGTKTLIASFNTEGKPIKSVRFPTPKNQQDYAKELLTTLQDSFSDTPIDALVVAVPGVIRNGVVKWCGNLPWENFKLLVFLQKHFTCPISIQNDADLAGLAEANSIKPVPELCLYLTISTGIGSGVVINGRLTPELSGSEAGHMMIECDGRIRSWESFASGKAIYTTYQKYAYQISNKHIWNKI
ncbi:ROK family protein, partial [Candidatus Saccharibacteria bacterium]